MKTLVMTVPHSGTHFLLRYLIGVLGLHMGDSLEYAPKESTCDFWHIHPTATLIEKFKSSDLCGAVIITLRHPHKSTQSSRMGGEKMTAIEDSWKSLIVEQKNYKKSFTLVIDGPEENRLPQLMAIAKHFGKDHLEPAIREYAENWTPVNQSITDDEKNAMNFAVRVYEQWQL